MTRKKVKLVWIANNASRKASLKKRRVGLVKKMSELTILCGVDALCVIYAPDDPEPLVWPSCQVAKQLLARYHGKTEVERSKKQSSQESYLRERIAKVRENAQKHQKRNRDMEMGHLMWQLENGKGIDKFDLSELYGLAWLIEEKLKDINKRVDYFRKVPSLNPPNSQGVKGGGSGGAAGSDAGVINNGGVNNPPEDVVTWEQWTNDLMNKNGLHGMPLEGYPSYGGLIGHGHDMQPCHHGNVGGNIAGGLGMGQLPLGNMGSSSSGGNAFDFGILPQQHNYATDGLFGRGLFGGRNGGGDGVGGMLLPGNGASGSTGGRDVKPSGGFRWRGRYPAGMPRNFPH